MGLAKTRSPKCCSTAVSGRAACGAGVVAAAIGGGVGVGGAAAAGAGAAAAGLLGAAPEKA